MAECRTAGRIKRPAVCVLSILRSNLDAARQGLICGLLRALCGGLGLGLLSGMVAAMPLVMGALSSSRALGCCGGGCRIRSYAGIWVMTV